MAKMKKKAEPVVLDINIKLADGKKAKGDVDKKFIITSPILNSDMTLMDTIDFDDMDTNNVNVVDKCVEISRNIDNLKTELVGYEKVLIEEAEKSKKEAFDKDTFVKTVYVTGKVEGDQKPNTMQVQFRESYSKLDSSMETPLKEIFGEKYPIMFSKNETATLRPEKMEALKTLLGNRYTDFFDISTVITPSADFSYNHFTMRKSFSKTQAETIKKITDFCRYIPAIKYPK